jgi:NADH-quinone oxidoreductase subunit A
MILALIAARSQVSGLLRRIPPVEGLFFGRPRGEGLEPDMDVALLVFTSFLLVGGALALILVTIPRWLAPKQPSEMKSRTYECGEEPVGEPWIRFRVEYYVFALMFVVFDVEAVFLYPWAVIVKKLGVYGLAEMTIFIGILLLGLAYAWRKGALEWR